MLDASTKGKATHHVLVWQSLRLKNLELMLHLFTSDKIPGNSAPDVPRLEETLKY